MWIAIDPVHREGDHDPMITPRDVRFSWETTNARNISECLMKEYQPACIINDLLDETVEYI